MRAGRRRRCETEEASSSVVGVEVGAAEEEGVGDAVRSGAKRPV